MNANKNDMITPNISQINILDDREYNIKIENNEYNLKVEIDQQYIYFNLSELNENLEYIYKNKMDLLTIINKLELNASKYSNLELILKIFDNIYKKNKILIKLNDDNSINILIKLLNAFEEEIINEIKLYKEYMNNNDKFNLLFNQIKLIKNIKNNRVDNNEIDEIKNKLNEMNEKMNKREEEIKDILNKKDERIKEMNEKIINQEKIIERNNKNLDEKINKRIEEIENKFNFDLNDKINNIKNKLINENNKQNEIIQKQNDIIEEYKINENKNNKELKENIELTKKLENEINKINIK